MTKKRLTRLQEMADKIQRRNEAFAAMPEGQELDLRMEFSTRLLKLMKRGGMTNAALCHRIGMKPPQLSKILSGEVDVRLATIWRLAQGLGVPPSRLLPGVKVEAASALSGAGK